MRGSPLVGPRPVHGVGDVRLEGGNKSALGGTLLTLALPAFCMLVFWGALYAVVSHLLGGGALTLGGVWSALVSAAQGNTYFHLWILYPLIGLYLVHPLLQRFASSASRGEILYILGLAFLFASVLPLWAAFHPNQVLTALLERFQVHMVLGYLGCYLAGWYLRHFTIGRIPEFLIYILGILGMVLTLAGPSLIGGGRELWYSYTAPGVALTAAALCTLFRYVLGVSEERSRRRAVYALGSASLGCTCFTRSGSWCSGGSGCPLWPWGRWPRCRCSPWSTSCSPSPLPGCSPMFRGLDAG